MQEAAFFDLDKTVIARAAMVAFGGPLRRGGLLSRRLLLRALYGQFVFLLLGADEKKLEKIRTAALAATRGWEKARVQAIVEESLEEVVEPIVYTEALELLQQHRDAGRRVFIVSASPEEVVAPLARHLGADGAIATRARLDDGGRYTGEVELWAYGPWKAEAMRGIAAERGIDLSASWAYSDSATDIPMLEAVGHPVAVNPDRELARLARERGWETRSFTHPVRLRDRVPVPPAKPAVGGTLLAATAAVAGWWWRRRARRMRLSAPAPAGARPPAPSWRQRRPARRG